MLTPHQTLAARQLRELRPDVRLVVVHPNFAAQHTLLESFTETFFYLRFHGTRLEYEQLWGQFESAWTEQQCGADAYIVLDECDRSKPEEFVGFLRQIIASYRAPRIFILTRLMPHLLLEDAELRSIMGIIPVNEPSMYWDYSERSDQPNMLLEVYGLGAGRALCNGKLIESWDGVLPRALFFYLIDRGMVTRAEIFSTFWPSLPVKEATNVFHVTKRKINEVLDTELTVYLSGFYHLSPKVQLCYDVAVFNKLVQDAAIASAEDAAAMLSQALGLYRGDFLSETDGEWVAPRRQSVRQAYCDALLTLGRIAEQQQDRERALSLYVRACRAHRTREDAVESAMRLSHVLGMRADALLCYDNLCWELARTTGDQPSATLQQLAASLRAG